MNIYLFLHFTSVHNISTTYQGELSASMLRIAGLSTHPILVTRMLRVTDLPTHPMSIIRMLRITGPCITNVFATRRKNFSQWHRSFQRKLLSHWLKFLRHVSITLVIQGPGWLAQTSKASKQHATHHWVARTTQCQLQVCCVSLDHWIAQPYNVNKQHATYNWPAKVSNVSKSMLHVIGLSRHPIPSLMPLLLTKRLESEITRFCVWPWMKGAKVPY